MGPEPDQINSILPTKSAKINQLSGESGKIFEELNQTNDFRLKVQTFCTKLIKPKEKDMFYRGKINNRISAHGDELSRGRLTRSTSYQNNTGSRPHDSQLLNKIYKSIL